MVRPMTHEVMTPKQMGRADALTIAAGTPGTVLMERAGEAVTKTAESMLGSDGRRVLILCGPGNNGGDGYVAARLLAGKGFDITVVALGDPTQLSGDAAWAFEGWEGQTLSNADFENQDLIIDALFGAGLTRALDGKAAELVSRANEAACPVLAVDLPSGLDGRTGYAQGAVIKAAQTVTFHRLKPGHALYPGRELCGGVHVADIGIDPRAVEEVGYVARLTSADLMEKWSHLPADAHKFAKGHALVIGGPPEKAGAGFLTANAALRAGAGLTTLAAPEQVLEGSIGLYPSLMRARCDTTSDLARLLQNQRLSSCVLGPGLTPDEATRQLVYAALESEVALVLDAGALSAFAGMAKLLFQRIVDRSAPTVLTPHEGEFTRLFGKMDPSLPKIERAQKAASQSGAVLVLKGADTVIAHPNGQADTTFINGNAPPWLATAGSGDVLAGILAGLLARSGSATNPVLLTETVALGVWMHGEAGQVAGPGLIASDLEPALRQVLTENKGAEFNALSADR